MAEKEFEWSMDHDENREEDGFDLRRKFTDEQGIDQDYAFWEGYFPEKSSVLEMMIALSIRCADMIFDPKMGDMTGFCFWKMVETIGLKDMTDACFDRDYCDYYVERMLKRRYKWDGIGGLFFSKTSQIDMRRAEIWYQMNVWVEENF